MEAFLISALAVAIGEFGDKTQLLAIMLAARLKQPLPIILGIAVATLANHTLAGLAGAWVRQHVAWTYLRWLLAGSFFAVAFAVTVFAFFLAEIGDKTQIATVVLAARFDDLVAVVAGTTLGMLVADVPAVLLGHVVSQRVPFRALRWLAAALFALMGVAVIFTSGFD
ncbi:MAG: TMEM165/GDT1 family protein [Betaproteobacteria bacterium]|nr:MAG: TMEM165/GDT1 family protein [Betaproteobacteria bacterium]